MLVVLFLDPFLWMPVMQGLIRFWPWSCSSKQVLFLNELEDVLELLMDEQVNRLGRVRDLT